MLRCTIAVMAYNEEQTIGATLMALLDQRLDAVEIDEILVVASGCTDRTVERAEAVARHDQRIRIEAQSTRSGKASAINHAIGLARNELIVLVGADTLPDPQAIEQLVLPFNDPQVGMTGGRVVPLNSPARFMGFAVQVLWYMHHSMALRWPKLGELVAFRKVIDQIPADSATDEVALEALISQAGYKLRYAPAALVYNYGPETMADFLNQRRRIFAGHLKIARGQGYVAASMPLIHLLTLTIIAIRRYIHLLPGLLAVAGLEVFARLLGTLDTLVGKGHAIWRPVPSSKKVYRTSRELTLLVLYCRNKSLRPWRLFPRVWGQQMPCAPIWWDPGGSRLLCVCPEDAGPEEIAAYAAELGAWLSQGHEPTVLAYSLLRFARPEQPAQAGQPGLTTPLLSVVVGD